MITKLFSQSRPTGSSRRDKLHLTADDRWRTLERSRSARDVDSLQKPIGAPGLWKVVRDVSGRRRWVFDMPPLEPADCDVSDDLDEDVSADAVDPLRDCIAWATDTVDGGLPDGWQPPSAATARTWVPSGALTVRAGTLVRQIELVNVGCSLREQNSSARGGSGPPNSPPGTAARLALRCVVVPSVPVTIPEPRRAWLEELLLDANDRWRMVRVGWDGAQVIAEVDLTGCPRTILESVFRTGLAALGWVVGWLVRSAAFLADPACGSAALEVRPVRA